jgi:hypothetical protein
VLAPEGLEHADEVARIGDSWALAFAEVEAFGSAAEVVVAARAGRLEHELQVAARALELDHRLLARIDVRERERPSIDSLRG